MPMTEMTPDEMRREGSWATLFYGREGELPALKKKDGESGVLPSRRRPGGEPCPPPSPLHGI